MDTVANRAVGKALARYMQCAPPAHYTVTMCARVTLPTATEALDLARQLGADSSATKRAIQEVLDLTGPTNHEGGTDTQPMARPGMTLPAFAPIAGSAENVGTGADTRKEAGGALRPASFTWGYLNPRTGSLVFNARIESAASPMWAKSFAGRRAIVPVVSFFEPHARETEQNPLTGRMTKRSYEFSALGGGLLLLGAIFDAGRVSIVTTEPNDSVSNIHDRMPLVVSAREVDAWLGPDWRDLADRSQIALAVQPEHPDVHPIEQLSLFA